MKSRIILSLTFALAFSINAFAQETLRVGDKVEYYCHCGGGQMHWQEARIEAVLGGNKVKVRYGNGRYQIDTVTNDPATIRAPGSAAKEAKSDELQNAFRAATHDKYFRAVQMFSSFYSDEFNNPGGAPTTPAGWQEVMTKLAELDALCKGQFAGVTNTRLHWLVKKGEVDHRYADWCQIAARREQLAPLVRASAAARMITVPGESDLRRALESSDGKGWVNDDIQLLMFEPAKFKQKHLPNVKKHFATYGVDVPADFFDAIEKKAGELKAIIEQTAPTRTFEHPQFKDAAVEAFVKGKLSAQHPGVQIIKSGTGYPSWSKSDSLSYLGSSTSARYYKVVTEFHKRGRMLVKLPNRPFCQEREWVVERASGKFYSHPTLGGVFMKCQ
ncbi:MAG TPA: hypothetical protein VJV21_02160 [Pyrinomonadaceae bacterium]|nr:hypothetical protein [Pyrinomonadaceae bacterium]